MNIKVIALGNRLMKDDSIGIKVAEYLRRSLISLGLEVIIAETDTDYCLNKIENNDYIIIIDSTYYKLKPGTISVRNLNKNEYSNYRHTSMHQYNLIDLINVYNKNISIILIGIEVESIGYSTNLSTSLENNFINICQKVYNYIYNLTYASSLY